MASIAGMLDKRRRGTHYTDRMQRILDVCHRFGLLWHDEKVTYRNGVTELKRVDDIEPVREVVVTPTAEKYGLLVNPAILSKVQTLAPQFAYALNLDAAQVSVKAEGNVVYVRVPRPGGAVETVDFDATLALARNTAKPKLKPGMVLVGVDDAGNPLALDFRKPTNVHAAAIGMTGSGKTTLLLSMGLSALQIDGVAVALFDPLADLEEMKGLAPLSGHDNIWRGGLFRDPQDIEAGLLDLAGAIGQQAHGRLLAIVDELPLLIAQRPPIRDLVGRLAEAGRHIGVNLLIGAQHAVGSELGPATMRNIPVRIVGRVDSTQAAYNAAGLAGTKAETLTTGAFVYVNNGTVVNFQAPLISDETMQAFTAQYSPRLADMTGLESEDLEPDETPVQATCISPGHFVRPEPAGDPGRPPDDIPKAFIAAIQREHERLEREALERGKENADTWPSLSWIERASRASYGAGYNRDKARRALELAGKPQEAADGTN